ncbi:MAG TPA: saccharopine dehydrogenase C-terminal domain-containing protein [Thermoplasmata archaeon]|nr:saccharopine dehydrogenase C-terminal domain-containing protein [Thermoplasmata archaeon]
MEVVVVGGGGLTGRCAVRDLAESRVFDRVRVADVDLPLAEAAARRAGGAPRVTPERIDVRDRSAMVELLRGAQVCVNAVQYKFNLEVMEACLAAGVHYLDFGGLFHMTRRQLELNDRFRESKLLAIPGLGQVPGVSNVLAAQATRDMSHVDSIVIRDGWKDLTVGGPEVVFTWSPSTFLDEMLLPAMIWENGKYREVPPMSDPEEYEFPPPIGRTRLFRTLHSEPATLPQFLEGKGLERCEWREGGSGIEVLRILAAIGLGSESPVPVDGHPVVPRNLLIALLKHHHLLGYPENVRVEDVEVTDLEIRGRTQAGPVTRHATAVFHSRPDWGLAATEYGVGVAGSIGAILIATGRTSVRGVVPPEVSIPAAPFREMLAERGIVTRISPPEEPIRVVGQLSDTT